jgi:periplasmic copper chaperone A
LKLKIIIAAVAVAALALPAAAMAHVTLQPDQVPAGGFARLDVRVPNERDDAATERVEVQMPDGFVFVSYEPVEGWDTEVEMERTDQPVESHGEEITEQVRTVTWTATDPQAAIQPGQFRDFGLSVGMPEDAAAGDVLTFPALQTYDSGEVVRWIGPPDAGEPAAQVTLTEAEEEHGAATEEEGTEGSDEEASAEPTEDEDDDDAPMSVGIAALILGGLGLLAGGGSLLAARRR